jgi:hypothetical protein
MEKKIERIENIVFKYAEGLRKNIDNESNAAFNINRWFSPLIKEINEQKGIVEYTFGEDLNHIQFKNMDDDLKKRVKKEFDRYRNEQL